MYDIRSKPGSKIQVFRLRKAFNSLPRLIIEPQFSDAKQIKSRNQSCIQKNSQHYHIKHETVFRKQKLKTHDFLQIMNLRKSSIYQPNRNVKHKYSTKSQQASNQNQHSNADDLKFCKQKLMQFAKEVVIARSESKYLRIRVKTQMQRNKNNLIKSSCKSNKLEPEARKLSILVSNKNENIYNFQRRHSRLQQKVPKMYPQSYPFKIVKTGVNQFSPWNSCYQDLLYTQP